MRILIVSFILVISMNSHAQSWVEETGHYTQLGLPIAALLITASKKDKKGAGQFIKSMALQTGTTIILKRAINRERPNGRNYSFPSGHTSLSFMSATYIYRRYGWKVGIPSLALATFVGYSRYGPEEPVHHFSDVVAGAAIGILSSWLFTDKFGENLQLKTDPVSNTALLSYQVRF